VHVGGPDWRCEVNKQVFQPCGMDEFPVEAVFTVSYDPICEDVHRAAYMNVARKLAKEFGLPGFWRVKQVAK
jgi:hypothetical protein